MESSTLKSETKVFVVFTDDQPWDGPVAQICSTRERAEDFIMSQEDPGEYYICEFIVDYQIE